MNTQGYGAFIRKHRLASGYKSQRALAEKTGINHATISRIEKSEQMPEKRTLQTLADYLTTTSYVELMVICGHWDDEELLEPINEKVFIETSLYNEKNIDGRSNGNANKQTQPIGKVNGNNNKETPTSNEEEFMRNIDLSDEEIIKKFNIKIDGRSLNELETQGLLAYIRSLRQMLKS